MTINWKSCSIFLPPGRLSGPYANATSGDKSAITARILLFFFFFLFKLIFILLSFLQLMVQGSSLLLAINLNFESEVPRNDGIKLYDNMGVLQGNKRIRQGATQPEISCELLHNWSIAAEDQYWCHNLHHWSWALDIHIIIRAASASSMVWAQSKMNGFQAICFFTSESVTNGSVWWLQPGSHILYFQLLRQQKCFHLGKTWTSDLWNSPDKGQIFRGPI